jgi:mevalonate kinase
MYRSIPGKILLFGEYSIITGSEALIIPFGHFTGRLAFPDRDEPAKAEARDSNRDILDFTRYLVDNKILVDEGFKSGKLLSDLGKGLYFRSTIPVGYGAGSSAALTAAVYDSYTETGIKHPVDDPGELADLRSLFARMESHFHGTSSGIDPVCCYTGRTILLQDAILKTVTIPHLPGNSRFFLLDTGKTGETGPPVREFKSRLQKEPLFKRAVTGELNFLVRDCIGSLLAADEKKLHDSLTKLSDFQYSYFESIIPGPVKRIWEEGSKNKLYTLKLCGSGGGGYFLGYSAQWDRTRILLSEGGWDPIELDL